MLFFTTGIISSARIHPYLALLCCRDYFFCSDASPACFFVLQGLFLLLRCIPSLLFCAAGMISSAQMHPQLAFFFRRDYFFRPDSSPACSFVPQGLLFPPGFIPILLFFSAGIIATAQIHLYLALFLRRDYFCRPASSLSCSFPPQRLFRPLGFILILLFFTTGIISAARLHPYLALPCCRDYFRHPDSSLSYSSVPQGLFLPLRCISILLFFTAGITATARIHLYLALFLRRDYF